jgi:hypothetical protein
MRISGHKGVNLMPTSATIRSDIELQNAFQTLNFITAHNTIQYNTIHEADIKNLTRRDRFGELGVDGRTTIKWNLKEQDVRITVGLIQLDSHSWTHTPQDAVWR